MEGPGEEWEKGAGRNRDGPTLSHHGPVLSLTGGLATEMAANAMPAVSILPLPHPHVQSSYARTRTHTHTSKTINEQIACHMQLVASQGTSTDPDYLLSPLTPSSSRLQPAFTSMTECDFHVQVPCSSNSNTALPLWRPRGVAMQAVDQNSYPRVLDLELELEHYFLLMLVS